MSKSRGPTLVDAGMPMAAHDCTGPSQRSSWRACSTAAASEPDDPTVLATLARLAVLGGCGSDSAGQPPGTTGGRAAAAAAPDSAAGGSGAAPAASAAASPAGESPLGVSGSLATWTRARG
jgi:hypothetical protein